MKWIRKYLPQTGEYYTGRKNGFKCEVSKSRGEMRGMWYFTCEKDSKYISLWDNIVFETEERARKACEKWVTG